jgi:hypothetical protein
MVESDVVACQLPRACSYIPSAWVMVSRYRHWAGFLSKRVDGFADAQILLCERYAARAVVVLGSFCQHRELGRCDRFGV